MGSVLHVPDRRLQCLQLATDHAPVRRAAARSRRFRPDRLQPGRRDRRAGLRQRHDPLGFVLAAARLLRRGGCQRLRHVGARRRPAERVVDLRLRRAWTVRQCRAVHLVCAVRLHLPDQRSGHRHCLGVGLRSAGGDPERIRRCRRDQPEWRAGLSDPAGDGNAAGPAGPDPGATPHSRGLGAAGSGGWRGWPRRRAVAGNRSEEEER